ncbi:MAG: HAD family hydrolase [Acholeplasmataceae bacterium]
MKTIIFFDIDNTIYDNLQRRIPPQTKQLILDLAQNKNFELGLATGRNLSNTKIMGDLLPLFKYRVLLNGAVAMINDEIIYQAKIKKTDIKAALEIAKANNYNVGMMALNDDAVNKYDERVNDVMYQRRGVAPKVDSDFYLKHEIYQLWILADDDDKLSEIERQLPQFKAYAWHKDGADFLNPAHNKMDAIAKLLENEEAYRLICVGDGINDVAMIEKADVGIAMANSRFETLKEKANLIAPYIGLDQLFDFFKSNNLI